MAGGGGGGRHFQENSLTMDSPGRKRHQEWFCPLFWSVPLAFMPGKVSFLQQAGLAQEEKDKEIGIRGPHPIMLLPFNFSKLCIPVWENIIKRRCR